MSCMNVKMRLTPSFKKWPIIQIRPSNLLFWRRSLLMGGDFLREYRQIHVTLEGNKPIKISND